MIRRVLLVGLLLVATSIGLVLFVALPFRPPAVATPTARVAWAFEAPQRGGMVSTPLVSDDRVFAAVIHSTAFWNLGALYCLDRATGKQLWRFDDDGKMQHMYSSPALADGRLFLGEGMHANFTCKLYCLEAATGRKLWDFVAEGHIESSPCVVGDRVYFAAGDDGVFALHTVTGKKVWHFRGPLHIDSSPAVSDGRLFVGSGLSRTYQTTQALCLDAQTGKPLWRTSLDLPAWGSPVAVADLVYFGLGNGRLDSPVLPPEKPAGGLVCLDRDTGAIRWRYHTADAVLARATADEARIYFGSRDGTCTCLNRHTGERLWQQQLGSPIATTPALADDRVYVLGSAGRIGCLDAATGEVVWAFDLARHTRTRPQLYSSPRIRVDQTGANRVGQLYFGAELRTEGSNAAVVYCLEDRDNRP